MHLARSVAAMVVLSCIALLALTACSGAAPRPTTLLTPDARGASAASSATAPLASTFPLTVTDSSGTAVTLNVAARAIVSHSPGATEILFAIGAGSQVIAADEFSDFPTAAKALKKVKYSDPNPEAEVALQPDLVILATNQKGMVDAFRKLGLPVLFNQEPDSLDGVLGNVRLLGRLAGRTAEADALATQMQARIAAVTSKVGDVQQGPTVFYELSDTLYSAAPNTFIGGMLSALKARNIAQGATSPFPQLTAEAVIAAGPEVILLADAKFGGAPEQVRARPGWAVIPAVKHDRLHPVDPDVMNRPGPRVVEGMEQMARLLYPDRFR